MMCYTFGKDYLYLPDTIILSITWRAKHISNEVIIILVAKCFVTLPTKSIVYFADTLRITSAKDNLSKNPFQYVQNVAEEKGGAIESRLLSLLSCYVTLSETLCRHSYTLEVTCYPKRNCNTSEHVMLVASLCTLKIIIQNQKY